MKNLSLNVISNKTYDYWSRKVIPTQFLANFLQKELKYVHKRISSLTSKGALRANKDYFHVPPNMVHKVNHIEL